MLTLDGPSESPWRVPTPIEGASAPLREAPEVEDNRQRGNHRRTFKAWNRVLRPSQAAKDHKINAYRCKVETEHYRSHQEIYKLRDHALRQKRKSDMYTQRIVLNIARRYGGYRD